MFVCGVIGGIVILFIGALCLGHQAREHNYPNTVIVVAGMLSIVLTAAMPA